MNNKNYEIIDNLAFSQLDKGRMNSKVTPLHLRTEWFELFQAHLIQSNNVIKYVCGFESAEKDLVCYLPVILNRRNNKLYGSSVDICGMSNFYSAYFNLIQSYALSIEDYSQLLQSIKAHTSRFCSLYLYPMHESDADLWMSASKRHGLLSRKTIISKNWRCEDIESVDGYWRERPKKLRNTIKRRRQSLNQDGNFGLVITHGDNLEKMLIDYHNVYFNSWKKQEPFPVFIDAITSLAAKLGQLRLGVLYHLTKPVAAQIWFVCADTAYIFKLAHVKDYQDKSVGTVLMADMFDYVIENDHVEIVDFMTGNDPYKQDWMSSSKDLVSVEIINPMTPGGRLKNARFTLSKLKNKLEAFFAPNS